MLKKIILGTIFVLALAGLAMATADQTATAVAQTATALAYVSPTVTPTITVTNTPTQSITPTSTRTPSFTVTPTYTPTVMGPGMLYMTPGTSLAGASISSLVLNYRPNFNAWSNGELVVTIPTLFPTPNPTNVVVTLSNPAWTPTVTVSGYTIIVKASSLMGTFGRINIAISGMTAPNTGGTYTFQASAKTLATQTPAPLKTPPQMIVLVATATATITPTSTATPTATPNPNAPISFNQPVVYSAYPIMVKGVDFISRVNNGSLTLADCSTINGIGSADFAVTLSPTANTTTLYPFSGSGLYFTHGCTIYTQFTTANPGNNTIVAHVAQ